MATRKLEVVIAGDARGLLRELGGAEAGLGRFGGAIGGTATAAIAGFAAVGAAAAGVGGALYAIGGQFDSAFDAIRVGTGRTGADLAALQQSFERVVASVPTDFGSAADAISGLSTRLGLTGAPLEALAGQLLNLSNVTGSDVATNVEAATRVIGDWSIATDDQAGSLDALFRASQATGTTVDGLASTLVQFGGPLRQLGFGFAESAALIGQFEAQGVNTELVLGGMRQALGRMARAGEAPAETFARVTEQIKEAGSAGEANALALELFGARAGPDMAAAIREGRFEIGTLLDTVVGGTDTINAAAADTADFSEKWQLLKNKVLVGLRPVAERVFGAVSDAMDRIIPVVERVMAVFEEDGLGGVFRFVGDALRESWPDIRRTLGDLAAAFWGWVQDVTPPLLAATGRLLEQLGRWLWDTGLPALRERLARWTEAFFAWAAEAIPPALRELGRLLGALGEWLLDEGLPLLAEKLAEWGRAFVEWIAPQIGPLLLELAKLQLRLTEWIVTDALPKIASKLLEWAWAFTRWVATDAIPGLLRELGQLIVRVGTWVITDGVPGFVRLGADLGLAMTGKIVEFFVGLPGRLGDALRNIAQFGAQFARSMINGLLAIWNNADVRFPRIEVPNWVPGIGGRGFGGFDIFPDVPYLHAGGAYRAPTAGGEGLAMLRDGEFVSSSAHASTSTTVVLEVDRRQLGMVVVDSLGDIARSQGSITLPIRFGGV